MLFTIYPTTEDDGFYRVRLAKNLDVENENERSDDDDEEEDSIKTKVSKEGGGLEVEDVHAKMCLPAYNHISQIPIEEGENENEEVKKESKEGDRDDDGLGKKTIVQLRSILKELGVPVSGVKPELIKRIKIAQSNIEIKSSNDANSNGVGINTKRKSEDSKEDIRSELYNLYSSDDKDSTSKDSTTITKKNSNSFLVDKVAIELIKKFLNSLDNQSVSY